MHDGVLPDSEGYHTYGLLWQPGHVEWFIDGERVQTVDYGASIKPRLNGVTLQGHQVGDFAYLDEMNDGMAIVLGTGRTMPITVDYVRAWSR